MKKPKLVGKLPDTVRTQYDHAALAALMRANPGQWVRIDKGTSTRMHALASKWRGAPPNHHYGPRRHFEFRAISSGYGTGEAKLFGRYIPEGD